LSAIIKGKKLEEALIWGTVNSASVIGYTGAQKGLLKEEDMDTWVLRFKSSGVKVVEMWNFIPRLKCMFGQQY